MIIQGLSVEIGAELGGLISGLDRARSSLRSFASDASQIGVSISKAFNGASVQKFGDELSQLGAQLSIGLSAPLAFLGDKFVDAARESDSLNRGLATLEENSIGLKKRLNELVEVAKLPGLGYKEAIQLDTSLRSAGASADFSKREMLGFGNALAIVGKGKESLKGLGVQLAQLATKTGGFGADIRIIKEYVPQVGKALQNAFGTIDTEKIAKLGLTGQQVIEKILEQLEKLPKATGGINNAFENFSDSVFKSMAKIGMAINSNFSFEAILGKLSSLIDGLVNTFLNLSPVAQSAIIALGGLAIVLPPIMLGIGGIISLLPVLGAGFAALTGPIGLVVIGIGIAVSAIIYHWDKVKAWLQNAGIFEPLVNIAKSVFGILISVMKVFASVFKLDWKNAWDSAKNIVAYAWNGIVGIIQSSIGGILGMVGSITRAFGATNLAKTMDASTKQLVEFIGKAKTDVPSVSKSIKDLKDEFAGFNFGGSDKNGLKLSAGEDEKAMKAYSKSLIEASNMALDAITEREDAEHRMRVASLAGMKDTLTKKTVLIDEEAFFEIQKLKDTLKDFEAFEAKKLAILTDAHNKKMALIQAEEITDRLSGGKKIKTGSDLPGALIQDKANPINLKGYDAFLDKIKEQRQVFDEQKRLLLSSLEDMNKSISTSLRQGAVGAIAGMSELVGGIIAGTKGLAELPNMMTGILAGLAKSIGKAMIEFGVAGIALKKLALAPGAAIAAGVALTILGSALEANVNKQVNSAPKFASGWGGATGSTMAWFGDNNDARTNQEFILRKDQVKSILNRAADQAGGGRGQGGGVSVVRGTDLIISNTRQINFDNAIRGR